MSVEKCSVCGGQPKPEGAAFFRSDVKAAAAPSFAEAQRLADLVARIYCSPECVAKGGGKVTRDSFAVP